MEPVTIRPLANHDEYAACVALQMETWGSEFREAAPPSILLVVQKLGGVASGAFDENGRLLGFVFGITGVRNGRLVHWSDLLAVRAEAQGRGIGRMLKEHQRQLVAAVGGTAILWTYDPLVARNAHLNFNVFGVTAAEYVVNMYGENTGSRLHSGLGTDRLIVEWSVDDAELSRRREAAARGAASVHWDDTPILGDAESKRLQLADAGFPRAVRVAVPPDIQALAASRPASAVAWRQATRTSFRELFGAGYAVRGFRIAKNAPRGHYLLSR